MSVGAEMYPTAANETRLQNAPGDGISCMRYAPDSQSTSLLVSSWDCTVRMYGTSNNTHHHLYTHDKPVLSCTFLDADRCASGSIDGTIKLFDLANRQESLLGTHDKAVRQMEYCEELGVLSTGSWDGTVKLWDTRIPSCTNALPQGERVYAMSQCGTLLIVGLGGAARKVHVWDLRQAQAPMTTKESSLKYQTRCIKAFPNKIGYVLSSIEAYGVFNFHFPGRVSVEYLTEDNDKHKKYAFKCHRSKDAAGQEEIFPVNALAFHPVFNTFATGGSDAMVNIWDPLNKKRLCQLHKYNTSISALCFNRDGSQLAIAASYQYEDVDAPTILPRDAVYIRKVTDLECKPKASH